jgi:hypothetical protein
MGTFALQLGQFAAEGQGARGRCCRRRCRQARSASRRALTRWRCDYWKSKPPKGYVGGRFRGNWQLGVGSIPSGETGVIDTGGGVAVGRIIAAVPEKAAGKVYYLTNNSPYGERIEDGWSRQAPQGLVALTAIEFDTFVRQAAA